MARKVYENQVFEGKSWSGYTSKNHLAAAYDYDFVEVSNRVEELMDFNLGESFVSMVMSHGLHTIEKGKDRYRWGIENNNIRYYQLLGAFEDRNQVNVVETTPGFRAGANRGEFFMLFEGNPFGPGEIIVGHKPDIYRIWVVEAGVNIGGDRFLYRVQLIAGNAEFFIPASELYEGTYWSSDGGLTPEELSTEGFGLQFDSNSQLENRMTQFRMEHTIPGNTVDIKPMGFYVRNKKGKAEQLWMTNIEYEYLKKARFVTASLIMNSQSNVWEDGSIGNKDKNGNNATVGAGFKQQWSTSNLYTFTGLPDLAELTEIALDTVAGKYNFSNRTMVIKAGEWGLRALSDMVAKEYGATAVQFPKWADDGTGRAFSWDDNKISVKTGQVYAIALVNGIQFKFVLDPSKDDLSRNKVMHPNGGPASSYEYDIMGFGGKDEKANMQIVRRNGETPIWGVEEGMRGMYKETGSFMSPKRLSHSVDGATVHYMEPGIGAIVWDPTKIVRYYPEITYS